MAHTRGVYVDATLYVTLPHFIEIILVSFGPNAIKPLVQKTTFLTWVVLMYSAFIFLYSIAIGIAIMSSGSLHVAIIICPQRPTVDRSQSARQPPIARGGQSCLPLSQDRSLRGSTDLDFLPHHFVAVIHGTSRGDGWIRVHHMGQSTTICISDYTFSQTLKLAYGRSPWKSDAHVEGPDTKLCV